MSHIPPLQIFYDPLEGTIVPDGKVSDWADTTITQWIADGKPERQLHVGSALMIDHVRLRVVRKVIEPSDLIFRFQHWGIYVNRDGRFSDCPRGFCDYTEDALIELLGWRDEV